MKIRYKSAGTSATILAVAVSVLGMSGCASIAGGSQSIGNAVGVKDPTMASTVGGCAAGLFGGAAIGAATKGGWIGAGIGAISGCLAGGFISREASIQQQLKEAQEQQKQINATLAQYHAQLAAVVYTKQVASDEKTAENHKIEAWDKTVVPMPPGHGPDVQAVLKKVASLTAASKKVPHIDVYVKKADEQAYSDALNAGLQGTKVMFATHIVTKNPHLDVTPIPDPAPAATTTAPASGAVYQPAAK